MTQAVVTEKKTNAALSVSRKSYTGLVGELDLTTTEIIAFTNSIGSII